MLFFLKVVMCGVSLILTALFAFTLSGLILEELATWTLIECLSAILIIAMGGCIDAGKYLFWGYRHLGRLYASISVSLLLFSWLASLAFLLTAEASLMARQQTRSPDYRAYQQQVAALQASIKSRQGLAKQQLNSRYHQQWQAAERQLQAIKASQQVLNQLLRQEAEMGQAQVLAALPTQQLFVALASLLSIEAGTVRLVGFCHCGLVVRTVCLGHDQLIGVRHTPHPFAEAHRGSRG